MKLNEDVDTIAKLSLVEGLLANKVDRKSVGERFTGKHRLSAG
jgi:hypothetical protein